MRPKNTWKPILELLRLRKNCRRPLNPARRRGGSLRARRTPGSSLGRLDSYLPACGEECELEPPDIARHTFLCPYCDKWNDLSPKSPGFTAPLRKSRSGLLPGGSRTARAPCDLGRRQCRRKRKSLQRRTFEQPSLGFNKAAPMATAIRKVADWLILGVFPALVIALPILLNFSPQRALDFFQTAASLLAFISAITLESLFFSTFGTTPGKWLLGISVREADGRKLSRIHALKRAFLATFGVFMWFQVRRDLKKKGATMWDRQGGYVVTYSPISAGRWFATSISTGVIFFAIICLVAPLDREYTKSRQAALDQEYSKILSNVTLTPAARDAGITGVVIEGAKGEATQEPAMSPVAAEPTAPSPTPEQAVDLPSDQLNQVQGLSVDAARGIVTVHNDSDFTLQSVDFVINLYSASGVYLHSYRFHAVAHSQCEPSSQGYLSFTPFDNDQLMNTFHGYFPKEQWSIVSASGIKP